MQQHALEDWVEEGYRALGVMEKHLGKHRFFVGDRYSIADIALYAYTHVAHQCDFDLSAFAGVRAWVARIEASPAMSRWICIRCGRANRRGRSNA